MGKRVLVVDDNRYTADSFARLLSLLGHEARPAYSGPEAVKCTADFSPDMVLLDIDMPGMDGYEAVRRLRQDPLHSHAIFVAVSGWARQEDQRRAYDAGFDLHVAKPISVERMKELTAMLRPTSSRTTTACSR
jgi:CheY-like chemotaxis protein